MQQTTLELPILLKVKLLKWKHEIIFSDMNVRTISNRECHKNKVKLQMKLIDTYKAYKSFENKENEINKKIYAYSKKQLYTEYKYISDKGIQSKVQSNANDLSMSLVLEGL